MSRASRHALTLAAAVIAVLSFAPAASAHPLGNFSVNQLDVVRIATDRVEVRYILDQAEIPTFQERGRTPGELLAAKRTAVLRNIELRIDGRPVALRFRGPGRIAFPPGQGGLRTTRVELTVTAPATGARRVELRDTTFAGRVGWRDVVIQPAAGTAVRSTVAASEPTNGLRRYPPELLSAPPDRRTARFDVRPGNGTIEAPDGVRVELGGTSDRGAGGFGGLIDGAAAGQGVLLAFLLAAFGWGALHALSPGHGKSMVAAYLVGSRGNLRDAVTLGATVTVTHTIGVFALGLVTLALSDYVLPEDLYPWLNLVAGGLVLVVGLYVLRARLRSLGGHGHDHHHHHQHQHHHHEHQHHHHDHGDRHPPGHRHDHHGHQHDHGEGLGRRASRRSLFTLGASAGLVPCPSALVVLLGAIAQHEVALGLILILAFSLGLAATLTTLGVLVVWSAGRVARTEPRGQIGRLLAAAPTVSAVVIVGLGCLLTVRALPSVL